MRYESHILEHDAITIVPLGDLHIGAPESNFKNLLEEIRKYDETHYFLFLGDLIDNSLKDSIGDVYTQTGTPEQCIEEVNALFAELRGRILGVVSGNHENRTTRHVGVDIIGMFCRDKKIPYDKNTIILDVTVRHTTKDRNYLIYVGHGSGGGRTLGGKANAAKRLDEIVNNAEVYISGHTHQPMYWKDGYFAVDRYNKQVRMCERHHIVIPAWLDYPEYAESKLYAPQPCGMFEITLDGKEKKIDIKMR